MAASVVQSKASACSQTRARAAAGAFPARLSSGKQEMRRLRSVLGAPRALEGERGRRVGRARYATGVRSAVGIIQAEWSRVETLDAAEGQLRVSQSLILALFGAGTLEHYRHC